MKLMLRYIKMCIRDSYKGMEHDWDSYLAYMHGQVREICSNYGKLDILWFDFSYEDMKGEKWKAKELVEMVRSLQPNVIIDNRLEGSGEEGGSLYTACLLYTSTGPILPRQEKSGQSRPKPVR